MPESREKMIADIRQFMQKYGGSPEDYYVGVTDDAPISLFVDRAVKERGDTWTYGEATSSQSAQYIEDYCVDRCGTDGGNDGADKGMRFVYIYKKAPHTTP